MAERGAIWLITIAALVALVNAQFKIGPFGQIQDGVDSNWPDDDKVNEFDPYSAAGNDEKIWLVSRRYKQDFSTPVKPGGIVSTLDLANNTWTHRSHTLNMNYVDFKLLSLQGRLIMLVFTRSIGIIEYGKLYSWNELEWMEIPFDPSVVENPVGTNIHLAVTVPDQSSNVAFLAASANDDDATQAVVSKLEVNFDADSQPIDAKLSVIHRSTYNEPVSILATPINDSQLYVFWYDSMVKPGEIVDLKTNVTGPFEITPSDSKVQSQITVEKDDFDYFQFRDRLIIQGEGDRDGKTKPSYGRHVWSFDMNTNRLQDATPWYPTMARLDFLPKKLIVDQKNALLYWIDFKYGVFRAKIEL